MIKQLLSLCLILLFGGGIALQAQNIPQMKGQLQSEIDQHVGFTGTELITGETPSNQLRHPGLGIGLSFYDLQTNGSVQRRLVQGANGELYGTWTMSLDEFDTSFPNRGTGYNETSGGNWGGNPDMRLDDRRTGWPSVNLLPDGSTVVVNHTSDATFTNPPLNILKKDGSGTWTQDIIPTNTSVGMLWPRSVTSEDGSIHVIAITTPEANGGAPINGVDGQLLYFRSTDGGSSWDITDGILPGSDNTNYSAYGGDSYSIDANAGTIAVAHFDDWNDITVYKSTDNGDNWTRLIVNDFPLDNYIRDTRYTIDDIGGVDTLGPGGNAAADSAALKAIYTSDNSGSVVVDNNGKVHVFYGVMYVSDDNIGDGNSSYYPGWNGLAYWNEDMPAGERPIEITGALDENGNGTLDIADNNAIALYFYSLSSTPYAAVDANDDIYLAYSAISESNVSANGQNYRHIYLMKSSDAGMTWSDPVDQINKDLFEDDDQLYQFVEAIFPTITVDDKYVHLIYQQDYEPGLHVRGDMDEVFEQEIIYLKVDKQTLSKVENVVRPEVLGMNLAPNPAVATTQVSFDVLNEKEVELEVISMEGRQMMSVNLGTMPSGSYQHDLNLSGLTTGTYMVRVIVGESAATMKLSVR